MNNAPDRRWAYDILKARDRGERVSPWALELAWNAVHMDQRAEAENADRKRDTDTGEEAKGA